MMDFRRDRNQHGHLWYPLVSTNFRCWCSSRLVLLVRLQAKLVEYFSLPRRAASNRLLVTELAALGAGNPAAVPGGVAFSGDWRVCYAANLWSRLASRVLWRVAEFDYRNEADLHEAARRVDWMRYFTVERTLRVNVSAQKSPLTSLDFATLRIKDAVCDQLPAKPPAFGRTSTAPTPMFACTPSWKPRAARFTMDTSGEPLFKRGWRAGAGEAPLRENLAAGIVMLSGWKPEEALLDPMCGGGTLLVEGRGDGQGQGARREPPLRLREAEGVRRIRSGKGSRRIP